MSRQPPTPAKSGSSGVICIYPTCHLSRIEASASLTADCGFPHNDETVQAAAKFPSQKLVLNKEME
jgi:hypothetical protein